MGIEWGELRAEDSAEQCPREKTMTTEQEASKQKLQTAWEKILPDLPAGAGSLLNEKKTEQILSFLSRMLEVNRQMNLTAITEPAEVMRLHVLDSLTLLPYLQEEAQRQSQQLSLLDLGSGAGFPGMPLKILLPEVDLTLLDALQKRVRFLQETATEIGLAQPWRALHGRSEDLARQRAYREQYTIVTARAVAALPLLLEYALGLVQPGGLFLAMKGSQMEDLSAAARVAGKMGAVLEKHERLKLPGGEGRQILVYRKTAATPARYPRPTAQMKKHPL